MGEYSKDEAKGLARNLNWIRKHGTKEQKHGLCGSGFTGGPKLTKKQHQQRDKDIRNNPREYDE